MFENFPAAALSWGDRLPAILHAVKAPPGITIAELGDLDSPTLTRSTGWLIKLGALKRQL